MTSPKMKISTARYLAMGYAPYFSAMLYKLVFREVAPGILPSATMGVTDRGICLYEKKFVDECTEKELAAVILHEINHLVRHHSKRMGTRDPEKWNLAGDAEINDDLQAMRLKLPGVPFVPELVPAPRGLTAEEYYAKMDQDGGKGGQRPKQPSLGAGNCGGCSGNGDKSDEQEQAEQEANATVGRSEAEMEMARDQVAQSIQQHAQKGRGNMPAGLVRWADAQLAPPKIPWETKLARACRRLVNTRPGAVDYRFGKISRRQAGVGYGHMKPILPGLIEPVPNVAVGLDTSGSMGQDEIMAGARETAGIMRAVGVGVMFIACDAAVHAVKQVSTPRELADCIKGGGGTDFRPIFKAVEDMNPRPEVFIFITDGGGPAPSHPPAGVSVIWLLAGPHRCRPYMAGDDGGWSNEGEVSYGVFIEMDD